MIGQQTSFMYVCECILDCSFLLWVFMSSNEAHCFSSASQLKKKPNDIEFGAIINIILPLSSYIQFSELRKCIWYWGQEEKRKRGKVVERSITSKQRIISFQLWLYWNEKTYHPHTNTLHIQKKSTHAIINPFHVVRLCRECIKNRTVSFKSQFVRNSNIWYFIFKQMHVHWLLMGIIFKAMDGTNVCKFNFVFRTLYNYKMH